jgi:hypothetical protein
MSKKRIKAPLISFIIKQYKGSKIKVQLKEVYRKFYKEPQSMKMSSVKLNIYRGHIYWFSMQIRKSNHLVKFKKGLYKMTKWYVNQHKTIAKPLQNQSQTNPNRLTN